MCFDRSEAVVRAQVPEPHHAPVSARRHVVGILWHSHATDILPLSEPSAAGIGASHVVHADSAISISTEKQIYI